MTPEKKLLATFIYSAYASGFCGLHLGKTREIHKNLYKKYIAGDSYYPEQEIRDSQEVIMSEIEKTSLRDYIYSTHFDVVKKRIEEESGLEFDDAIQKSKILKGLARSCPINFYEVIKVNQKSIVGQNLYIPQQKKELIVLEGLVRPTKGDIVSGHWDYFLEVLEPTTVEKYSQKAKDFFERLRDEN